MNKKIINYPETGKIQFKIKLDKNNQIHDILFTKNSFIPEDEPITETLFGIRPVRLFNHIHGRPVLLAQDRIDSYIDDNIE